MDAASRALPLAVFSLSLLVSPCVAQEDRRDWVVEDVVMQERTSSWQLSRDGSKALWIRTRGDKEADKGIATLMLTTLATNESRELTVGQESIGSPKFSPDGHRIAFTSGRDFPKGMEGLSKDEKGSQIWILDLRGGEARPVTKIPHGVRSFEWGDDDTIYLTARDAWSRREAKAKKAKDKTRVVEDIDLFRDGAVRLFRFSLDDKKLKRLTTNRDRIQRFFVSPKQRYVIAVHSVDPANAAEGRFPPRVVWYDLESGSELEIYGDRKSKPRSFAFWRDGEGLYARVPHMTIDGEDSASIQRLDMLRTSDLTAGRFALERVDLDWDRSMSGSFFVTEDGFVTGLAHGVETAWARYVRQADGSHAKVAIESPSEWPLQSLVRARDANTAIFVVGDASEPDHVMQGSLQGATLNMGEELYRPNKGFAKLRIAKTEVTRWKGANDEEVEGILYWPKGYREGERYPLVLVTHGGPHAADRNRFSERWSNTPNFYSQRGAFVLKTNYHGSSGYGLAFGESIRHRYYELEVVDLARGIQALVDRGLVDKGRIGLVGWSNGAILSTAMLTHLDDYAPGHDFTFRVAAPGAGDVNWTSDYGNCAFGASFDEFYLGGTPWSNPVGYIEKSPMFRMQDVTTPTIIFFGTEDTAVPTSQGWEHYRAMHRIGKAPVRFLLFPGEPHGLRKLTHQTRKLTEELAWVDRHLFETEAEVELVAGDSPLAVARRMQEVAVADASFGSFRSGTLIPETVPFGDVAIGRFEVTRVQWRAFRGDYAIPTGTENLPITGISADDAKAYCAWLSATTGAKYRLPTVEEHDKLAMSKGARENDLKRWVGYSPSLEDAARVQAMIEQLGVDRALLPVGSCPPGFVGEGRELEKKAMVFDIGGNAAEWVVGEGGSIAKGGCAVLVRDERAATVVVPLAYTGLRVVRDS